jgi:L-lysine exporter family protein LysE/ArgO
MLTLLEGFILGLGAAVPIGPVNVEIARRTLRSGFVPGFALGCGAVTVDVTYAALTSLSVARFLTGPMVKLPLLFAGAALLTYLGITCLVGAAKAVSHEEAQAEPVPMEMHRNYLTGLMMTLLNPMTLVFWLVAVPAAGAKSQNPNLPLLCAGVFAGTLCWTLFFGGMLSLLRRFRQRLWMTLADLAGGLILLFFAITSAFAGFRSMP